MIKDNLMELKEKREFLQKSAEIMKQAREEFDKNNAGLMKQIDLARVDSLILIDRIQTEAIANYNKTGDKEAGYGVKIRIKKDISYDEENALSWAKKHDMALQLDRKAFNQLALTQDISFVRIDLMPTATIPQKIVFDIGDIK